MPLKLVSSQSKKELAERKSKRYAKAPDYDPPEFEAEGLILEVPLDLSSSAPVTDEELLRQAKALGTVTESLAQQIVDGRVPKSSKDTPAK